MGPYASEYTSHVNLVLNIFFIFHDHNFWWLPSGYCACVCVCVCVCFRELLSLVGKTDNFQLHLVFNSIDTNGDGQLSLAELNQFALELGYEVDTYRLECCVVCCLFTFTFHYNNNSVIWFIVISFLFVCLYVYRKSHSDELVQEVGKLMREMDVGEEIARARIFA